MFTFVIWAIGIAIILIIGYVMLAGFTVIWQVLKGLYQAIVHPKTKEELEEELRQIREKRALMKQVLIEREKSQK